jgi:hypothetical protein
LRVRFSSRGCFWHSQPISSSLGMSFSGFVDMRSGVASLISRQHGRAHPHSSRHHVNLFILSHLLLLGLPPGT